MTTRTLFTVSLVVWVLFSFSNCGKGKSFVVVGKVTDHYSQNAVENVKIELEYNSIQGGTYTSSFQPIQEVYSNPDGSFEFYFDYVSAVSYRIRTYKDGYERGEFVVQRDDWTVENDNYVELKIFGQSKLNVKLINNYDHTQYVLRFYEHSSGCSSCCEAGSYFLKDFLDTSFTCTIYSNQNLIYDITDVSIGEESKKKGSIFIEPGDNLLLFDLDAN